MAARGDDPFLPPEIIINILKRLPIKYLVRFRSVCKDWKNLFKTAYFIEEHYHYSAHKNPFIILDTFPYDITDWPICLLRYKMESVEVDRITTMDCSYTRLCEIIGSCNGLLLVKLYYEYSNTIRSLLLLNPATREVRQVPRTKNDGGHRASGWGLGFSPVVRDYKIVRIHDHYVPNEFGNIFVNGVAVYSLRTDSWKEVEFGAIKTVHFRSKSVSVDGAIFWLGFDEGDYQRRRIVSFDLETEVFTLIPLPSSISISISDTPRSCRTEIDVYKNKVAVLHRSYTHESSFIDIWVLEESCGTDGKSWGWTEKYSIGPTPRLLDLTDIWWEEINRKNHECVRNDLMGINYKYHLFHLTSNNEWKKFHIFYYLRHNLRISNYAESLVSMCDIHVE